MVIVSSKLLQACWSDPIYVDLCRVKLPLSIKGTQLPSIIVASGLHYIPSLKSSFLFLVLLDLPSNIWS
jgi:hypothetical protein